MFRALPNFTVILAWILVGFVALAIASAPAAAAATGYWRYARTEVTPPQADLDATSRANEGKVVPRVTGAFQAKYAGKGSIDLYFKTQDVDGKVYLSKGLFTFGTSSDMGILRPGQELSFEGSLVTTSNWPGASATASMAVDYGENFLTSSATVGNNGSGSGRFKVPGGGPGAALRVIANAQLSNYGALAGTLTNFYDWVEGPAPAADEAEPGQGPSPRGNDQSQGGSFSGQWSTSEGDMGLSQSGGNVTGTYSQDTGRIGGEVRGDHLIGYWGENSSAQQCDTERLGTSYWGRIDWTLAADGQNFTGTWSYCDAVPAAPWSGQRTGEQAPSASGEIVITPDNEIGIAPVPGGEETVAPNSGSRQRTTGGESALTPDNGEAPGVTVNEPGGGQSPDSGAPTAGEGAQGAGDHAGGQSSGHWNSPAPASSSAKFADSWNTASCGVTDTAILDVGHPIHLDRFDLWIKWLADERSADYRVLFGGSDIGGGVVHRGDCDPFQGAWCAGSDRPDVDLPAGQYKIRIDHKAICQNPGSNGAGFIRAWGH